MEATHKITKKVYNPENEKLTVNQFIKAGTEAEVLAYFEKLFQRAKNYAVQGVSGNPSIYKTKRLIQFHKADGLLVKFEIVKLKE